MELQDRIELYNKLSEFVATIKEEQKTIVTDGLKCKTKETLEITMFQYSRKHEELMDIIKAQRLIGYTIEDETDKTITQLKREGYIK